MGPSTGPQAPLPRKVPAVPNFQVPPLPREEGHVLFLLEGEESRGQNLATWSPTPSSFALPHSTPIPLMQEEYQEYEPEA